MPLKVIEAQYTMTDTAAKLQRRLDDAQQRECELREEVAQERVQRSRADGNALFWYRLCFILVLILVALLVAGSIIVFRGSW